MMKRLSLFILLLVVAQIVAAQTPEKPKLVVQIVVSQMRYDYLQRFAENFSEEGFARFTNQGVNFSQARYNYMLTNTPAGLATLATGANPATHGIFSERWIDYTAKKVVELVEDSEVTGLECDAGVGQYSPLHLIAETLGDRIKQNDARSKVISLATDPLSAIVSGGHLADTYWLDEGRATWMSSSYYFRKLPSWVSDYNKQKFADLFLERDWEPMKAPLQYKNSSATILQFKEKKSGFTLGFLNRFVSKFKKGDGKLEYATLLYTPAGNSMVSNFAKQAIIYEELGKDAHTDLLTICYDTPRLVGERFGPRSIEVEDMYYQLDRELGELTSFILAQFKQGEVLLVLTSDHGASNTYNGGSRMPMGLFNAGQFKMIMNAFLSAQYEPGNWVLDYYDRQLYLNRELIYNYAFNLSEVQAKAATFALQFRGVSGAITGAALQNNSFARAEGEKMQNSFYPKRAGDVMLNLMPEWIEELPDRVSQGGSLYEYDTHVPLMFLGGGFAPQQIDREISMESVAPTLARILRMEVPSAATGRAEELTK